MAGARRAARARAVFQGVGVRAVKQQERQENIEWLADGDRLSLDRIAAMPANAVLREWRQVGREIGRGGQWLARIGLPRSQDAARWNACRLFGVGDGEDNRLSRKHYRIVTDRAHGFEAQARYWWWPFWCQLNGVNTHRTVEEAVACIERDLAPRVVRVLGRVTLKATEQGKQ